MNIRSKQGYQLLEASLVMPLVILMSVSVILLTVFFYECLDRQCIIHEEQIETENKSKELYKEDERVYVQSGNISGIADILMQRELYSSICFINESMIVRIGDKGYEFQE